MAATGEPVKTSVAELRPEDFEKASKILEDPKALEDIFKNMDGDNEEMYEAIKEMRNDREFNRVTGKMSDSEKIKESVGKLSFKQKKKIQAKAAAMQKPPSERVADGVSVVIITPSRKYKTSLIPRDFKASPRHEGWILEKIKTSIYFIFHNPKNMSKNRVASRITGKNISNELFIFKIDEDGFPIATTVAEVEACFR